MSVPFGTVARMRILHATELGARWYVRTAGERAKHDELL
jgi:hypothetical protein